MKALQKDTLREIRKSLSRFLSIVAIIALGIGFFSGVKSTSPSMKETADEYYRTQKLMDIHLISTYGFTDEDLTEIGKTEGVGNVEEGYTADLLVKEKDKQRVAKVYSLSESDEMNVPLLMEGRLPEKDDECVIEVQETMGDDLGKVSYPIGSTITFSDKTGDTPVTDTLTGAAYKVVGYVRSPMYVSIERGSTTVGTGNVDFYMMVRPSVFKSERYTDAYVRGDFHEEGLSGYSDAYDEQVAVLEKRLEETGQRLLDQSYQDMVLEGQQQLDEGRLALLEAQARFDSEIIAATTKLSDSEQQIIDGEAALRDGEAAYHEKMVQAEAALNENANLLEQSEQQYQEGLKAFEEGFKAWQEGQAAFDAAKPQAEAEFEKADALVLEQSEQQYQEGLKAFEEGFKAWQEGQAAFDAAKPQAEAEFEKADALVREAGKLLDGLKELVAELEQKDPTHEWLPYLKEGLLQAEEAYDKGCAALQEKKDAFYQAETDLTEAKTQLDQTQKQLDEAAAKLEAGKLALSQGRESLESGRLQGAAELEAGRRELEEGRRALEEGRSEYERQKAEGERQLQEAMESGRLQGAAELEAGRRELEEGRRALEEGRSEYERQKAEGERQLQEAKAELEAGEQQLSEIPTGKWYLFDRHDNPGYTSYGEDADRIDKVASIFPAELEAGEQQLSEIPTGKWYLFDRHDNPGYTSYGEDADRIDKVASIFPVFFLLVAALVSFTTMTRMVEEQRMEIGTLKALGYGYGKIAAKYIFYAASAAVIGCGLGIVIGVNTLPYLITTAYSLLYNMPSVTLHVPWIPVLLSCVVALLCTTGAAIGISWFEFRNEPSELMRPKAPKVGKRIFLERITPIWRRMGFISKVTARNIFRYKARFIMTVVGIAGCTALILAGFGLQDSIFSIVPQQFGEIAIYDAIAAFKEEGNASQKADCTALILAGFGLQDSIFSIVPQQFGEIAIYDAIAAFKEEGNASQKADVVRKLEDDADIAAVLPARQMKMNVSTEGYKGNKEVYTVIPEDPSALPAFTDLHDRKHPEEKCVLGDDGVIITEKLARDMGVSPGDHLMMSVDEERYDVTISGIAENYIENYVYLSPQYYEKISGKETAYNLVFVNLNISGAEAEDALAERWLAGDDLVSMTFTEGIRNSSMDSLKSLNMVVLVMLFAAGALAFVVLYNLTNINVSERVREIATIRVLGFYEREVDNYIFRENIVLSLIGMCFGLFLGILLNNFIITTVETDIVMFGRGIEGSSYIFACLFTMAFTLIVNVFMKPVIRKIDMVESLKSIE